MNKRGFVIIPILLVAAAVVAVAGVTYEVVQSKVVPVVHSVVSK